MTYFFDHKFKLTVTPSKITYSSKCKVVNNTSNDKGLLVSQSQNQPLAKTSLFVNIINAVISLARLFSNS
jgi:hypothetical protein